MAFLALGETLGLFKNLLGNFSALRATICFVLHVKMYVFCGLQDKDGLMDCHGVQGRAGGKASGPEEGGMKAIRPIKGPYKAL